MVVIGHNHQNGGLARGPPAGSAVRGGEAGAEGTLEIVAQEPRSYTGGHLKPMLAKRPPSAQPAARLRRAQPAVS